MIDFKSFETFVLIRISSLHDMDNYIQSYIFTEKMQSSEERKK